MDDREEKQVGFFRLRNLPDPQLKALWRDIVLNVRLKRELFIHVLLGPHMDADTRRVCAVYGFALLYGQPGCGKTTLAFACANRVAERVLWRTGKRTKLLLLNVAQVFSAFLGESVKGLSKSFADVRMLARHNPVILMLEEIESIGVERSSLGAGDPSEIGRFVAGLLGEIDELRLCKDVAIIGTSNLEHSIDRAVLDRADLKLHIPRPDDAAAVKLLERGFAGLGRYGVTVEPSVFAEFVRRFYDRDGSDGPFSGRDLCRIAYRTLIRTWRKRLTSQDVLRVAESMLAEDGKENEDGNSEKKDVHRNGEKRRVGSQAQARAAKRGRGRRRSAE